jgi:hypothetical protein
MIQKLRIGLLIESEIITAWSYKMLRRIASNENLEVVLMIKHEVTPDKQESFVKKTWANKDKLLWILYSKFENKLFKPQPNAFEQKNIHDILNCDTLNVQTERLNNAESFKNKDIESIRDYNIDVLINLCFVSLTGGILNTPKYGIWSYSHGDRSVNRGGPPGAWEVFKNQDRIGTILEILSENVDEGVRLETSYSATEKLSVNRTTNNMYWKAVSILPRKLDELYRLGETEFFKKVRNANSHPEFFDHKVLKAPTNKDVLGVVYRIYSNKILKTIKSFFYFNQWILLFKFEKEDKWSTSFHEFKKIVPPKDRFWADPFIWIKNERYYIFFEELIYKDNIGKIAVLEIDEEGNYGSPEIVLDKPYHLSYPFLIEENEELFMIPETAGNRTIEMYRCIDFPLQWELHKVLMENVNAVDSTILRYNDMYWLFCNIRENEGASSLDELFLFYSDSLLDSDWESHPCNPIVSDVSQSRPAGNIFERHGKIYRPSQNSANGYGRGMKINEITELTTSTYQEVTVQSINPNWAKGIISTHTLNHNNKITVIDAMVKRYK